MGYTLSIGNAVVTNGKDCGELWARWSVEDASSVRAPNFPNDTSTGNTNVRRPSYSTWHDFAEQVGLESLFYDEDDGILARHPGCVLLTKEHYEEVLDATIQWATSSTKPPGFCAPKKYNSETKQWESAGDEDQYDCTLARLLWLQWWMHWALKNCETPAFENS